MRPLPIFAVLFLVVPLVELYFLIKVGDSIGAWRTIFLVILTAVVGAILLKQQGMATIGRFQKNMMEGKAPAGDMLEGVFLLIGGAMLLLPGFFTDALGFLCLIPFTRQLFAGMILKNSSVQMNSSFSGVGGFSSQASNNNNNNNDDVIDGEFVRQNDDRLNNK